MGCGSSSPAAGESTSPRIALGDKYAPGPDSSAAAKEAPKEGAREAKHATPHDETICLHSARVVSVPLPPPHHAFVCYRGAGTSWGFVKARVGQALSSGRPLAECEVVEAPGGDSVRIGCMTRREKLSVKPGFGDEASSVGWSPSSGIAMCAEQMAAQSRPYQLQVGDRITLKLGRATAEGAHAIEFLINCALVLAVDVPVATIDEDTVRHGHRIAIRLPRSRF